MTLTIITAAAIVLSIFLLILAIRVWQRERPLLYLLTPLLLGFALYSWTAIDQLLGYATGDLSDLRAEFTLVTAFGHDPAYLLAIPHDSAAPRLYAIPKSMLSSDELQAIRQGLAKLDKGVPQSGTFREGQMEIYDFDVSVLAPKTQ